jgi:hypothetical protein
VITLHRDTLTFTFPEIAREIRSLVNRKIKDVAAELPPTWDRDALVSKIESNRDFHKLSEEERGFAHGILRTWIPASVEARLESAILDRGGLNADSLIHLSVKFQRARPIPNDSERHALPMDLGQFPLRSVDDFAETAPEPWLKNGGVVMPLAESEAPWIWFSSAYRFAIKIGVGDADVLSSAPWGPELGRYPRNYLVIPDPSLEEGYEVIRQFVNMPLHQWSKPHQQRSENAYTEAIQLQITPARTESYNRDFFVPRTIEDFLMRLIFAPMISKQLDEFKRQRECRDARWRLGAKPFQEPTWLTFDQATWPDIPQDIYDLADWDQTRSVRCFVHLCDPPTWQDLQRVKTRRHAEIREFKVP